MTISHLMKGMLEEGKMIQTHTDKLVVVELFGSWISAQFTGVVFKCVFSLMLSRTSRDVMTSFNR